MPSLFALHHAGLNVRDLEETFRRDKDVRKFDNFHRFLDSVHDCYKGRRDYGLSGAKDFLRLGRNGSSFDLEDRTTPILWGFTGNGKVPTEKKAILAVNASAAMRKIKLAPGQAENLGHLLRFHYVMTRPGFKGIYADAYAKFENVSRMQDATAGRKQ